MTHYAALDVSLRSVAICIVDSNGDIKLERSVDSEVEDIVRPNGLLCDHDWSDMEFTTDLS